MQNKQAAIFILLFTFLNFSAYGQKKVNSPYHRFNLGGLSQPGSFRSLAMGGTGIAMRENSSIYFSNPASYTGIDTTSFIFDFGFDLAAYGLTDGTSTHYSGDMNFNHLFMGFPVKKRAGIALGLVPLTNGYYYLSQTSKAGEPGYDPLIGEVSDVHQGTGGIAGFFIGSGYRLTKNLSAGVNMTIMLGEIKRLNQFEFSDYSNTFNQRGSEVLRLAGLNLDYGLQYSADLKNKHFITTGISFTGSKNYRTSREVLKERFAIYASPPYSPDTLTYFYSESRDSTRLPASYRFGLSFGKKDKLTAEFDYIYTNWSEASIHGNNSNLGSTSSYMLGLEYIPDKFSNVSFLKRIEYRMGLHYADNYLVIRETQLREYGASAGLAVRLRNSYSKLTWYFDYTRRQGDLAKGLPNEDIFSLGVSLNLYDFWFVQKKYD